MRLKEGLWVRFKRGLGIEGGWDRQGSKMVRYLDSSSTKRTVVLQEFLDVFWIGDLEHSNTNCGCHFRFSSLC